MTETPFKIKPDLPKTARINKTLILSAALVVVFILVFAIVSGFSDTPTHAKATPSSLSVAQDTNGNQAVVVSDVVKKLPQSYHEADKIKQFSQQKTKNTTLPPEVTQELTFLKQQQAALQQRLTSMRVQKTASSSRATAMALQAQNSNLFFPGAMPTSENALKRAQQSAKPEKGKTETGAPTKKSAYEQQNMQDQKINFLKPSDEAEDIYDLHNITTPISPYEVQAGTLIPAVLITGVNTSLPGDAIAQVRQDIYDSVTGRFLLIPKGSKLIGEYDSRIAYGQRRVLMAFTRVIRPDGSSILLSKYSGSSLKGEAGMEGVVDNHWMRVLGAATLSTILSVGVGSVSDNSASNNTLYTNSKQGALLGAASNVSQVGQNIANRAINIQPTLKIPSGFEFNIIVRKDMVLTPYQTKASNILP